MQGLATGLAEDRSLLQVCGMLYWHRWQTVQ